MDKRREISISYGLGYSPMESEAPFISICDINNDAEPDLLICGTSYRTELRQDVYLSYGTNGYIELGDVTWNKNDVMHPFLFKASYIDAYQVHITAPDWNIDETMKVEEALAEQLVSLGLYDGHGNVTEYGRSWICLSYKVNPLNIYMMKTATPIYTMRHKLKRDIVNIP